MPTIPARRWPTCRPFASVSASCKGLKLAFVGDGNNVAHSLMLTALRLGMDFALGCPQGYQPESRYRGAGRRAGGGLGRVARDHPRSAGGRRRRARGLHRRVGQHGAGAGSGRAPQRFPPYQVNDELFAQARPDAVFMHCLPAKRGEESHRLRDGSTRARWCSIRRRTGCTRRRRCC